MWKKCENLRSLGFTTHALVKTAPEPKQARCEKNALNPPKFEISFQLFNGVFGAAYGLPDG
jgi:hypothetical protein